MCSATLGSRYIMRCWYCWHGNLNLRTIVSRPFYRKKTKTKTKEFRWWLCEKRVFSLLYRICSRHTLFGGYPKAFQILFLRNDHENDYSIYYCEVGSFFLWSDTTNLGHTILSVLELWIQSHADAHIWHWLVPLLCPDTVMEWVLRLGCHALTFHLQVNSPASWRFCKFPKLLPVNLFVILQSGFVACYACYK